jgi:hypothetical protein
VGSSGWVRAKQRWKSQFSVVCVSREFKLSENLKGMDHFGNLGVYSRIILKGS